MYYFAVKFHLCSMSSIFDNKGDLTWLMCHAVIHSQNWKSSCGNDGRVKSKPGEQARPQFNLQVTCFVFSIFSIFPSAITLICSPTETLMEQYWSAWSDWFRERPTPAQLKDHRRHKNNATANVRRCLSGKIQPVCWIWHTPRERKLTRTREWTRRWPVASCSLSWGN